MLSLEGSAKHERWKMNLTKFEDSWVKQTFIFRNMSSSPND